MSMEINWFKRREGVAKALQLGYSKEGIARAVGTNGRNLGNLLRREAPNSKFVPRLDQWLKENVWRDKPRWSTDDLTDGSAYIVLTPELRQRGLKTALRQGYPLDDIAGELACSMEEIVMIAEGRISKDITDLLPDLDQWLSNYMGEKWPLRQDATNPSLAPLLRPADRETRNVTLKLTPNSRRVAIANASEGGFAKEEIASALGISIGQLDDLIDTPITAVSSEKLKMLDEWLYPYMNEKSRRYSKTLAKPKSPLFLKLPHPPSVLSREHSEILAREYFDVFYSRIANDAVFLSNCLLSARESLLHGHDDLALQQLDFGKGAAEITKETARHMEKTKTYVYGLIKTYGGIPHALADTMRKDSDWVLNEIKYTMREDENDGRVEEESPDEPAPEPE